MLIGSSGVCSSATPLAHRPTAARLLVINTLRTPGFAARTAPSTLSVLRTFPLTKVAQSFAGARPATGYRKPTPPTPSQGFPAWLGPPWLGTTAWALGHLGPFGTRHR